MGVVLGGSRLPSRIFVALLDNPLLFVLDEKGGNEYLIYVQEVFNELG